MANTGEADLCNVALARVGQSQFITSLDPAIDGSAQAAVCAVVYPSAREALLSRFRWGWATSVAILAPNPILTIPGQPGLLPGWEHAYSDPSDLLEPQYIFDGVRPGMTVAGSLMAFFGVTAVGQLPLVSGSPPLVSFEHVGGSIFTDWSDDPAAWDSTIDYPVNAVVSSGGSNWRCLQTGNQGDVPIEGSEWTAAADPSSALLVYTAQQTDPTVAKFPALFKDALRWALAAELALSLASKPELAAKFSEQYEKAYLVAAAAEGRARAPDARPESSFISVRG